MPPSERDQATSGRPRPTDASSIRRRGPTCWTAPWRSRDWAPWSRPGSSASRRCHRAQLEGACVRPAAGVGVAVAPELAAELVAEVADRPGALPLFEYALTECFDARAGGALTLAGYRGIGGLRGGAGPTCGLDPRRAASRRAGGRPAGVPPARDDRRRRRRHPPSRRRATIGHIVNSRAITLRSCGSATVTASMTTAKPIPNAAPAR
jgi:hypothetical protein